jgi:hypothetical protein
MMSTPTTETVRAEFVQALPDAAPDDPDGATLDLTADMADDYGLGSLTKVLFLTSVCDALEVSLATFTEVDLAGLRTLGDVVAALQQRMPAGAAS